MGGQTFISAVPRHSVLRIILPLRHLDAIPRYSSCEPFLGYRLLARVLVSISLLSLAIERSHVMKSTARHPRIPLSCCRFKTSPADEGVSRRRHERLRRHSFRAAQTIPQGRVPHTLHGRAGYNGSRGARLQGRARPEALGLGFRRPARACRCLIPHGFRTGRHPFADCLCGSCFWPLNRIRWRSLSSPAFQPCPGIDNVGAIATEPG